MKISLEKFFNKINQKILSEVIKGTPNILIDITNVSGTKFSSIPSLFLLAVSEMFAAKMKGNFKETNTFSLEKPQLLLKLYEFYQRHISGEGSEFYINIIELIILFDYLCTDQELILLIAKLNDQTDISFDEFINLINATEIDEIKLIQSDKQKTIIGKILQSILNGLCEYSPGAWNSKVKELVAKSSPERFIQTGEPHPPIHKLYCKMVDFSNLPFDLVVNPKFVLLMCKLLSSEKFVYSYSSNAFPADLLIQMDKGTIPEEIIKEYVYSYNSWFSVDFKIADKFKMYLKDRVSRYTNRRIFHYRPDHVKIVSGYDEIYHIVYRYEGKSIPPYRNGMGRRKSEFPDEEYLVELYIVRLTGIRFNEMKIGQIGNYTNVSYGMMEGMETFNFYHDIKYRVCGDTLLCSFKCDIDEGVEYELNNFRLIDHGEYFVDYEEFKIPGELKFYG